MKTFIKLFLVIFTVFICSSNIAYGQNPSLQPNGIRIINAEEKSISTDSIRIAVFDENNILKFWVNKDSLSGGSSTDNLQSILERGTTAIVPDSLLTLNLSNFQINTGGNASFITGSNTRIGESTTFKLGNTNADNTDEYGTLLQSSGKIGIGNPIWTTWNITSPLNIGDTSSFLYTDGFSQMEIGGGSSLQIGSGSNTRIYNGALVSIFNSTQLNLNASTIITNNGSTIRMGQNYDGDNNLGIRIASVGTGFETNYGGDNNGYFRVYSNQRSIELTQDGLHINGYVGGTPTKYILPPADGTSGQALVTNGGGVVSWTTISSGGGGATSVSGAVTGTISGSDIATTLSANAVQTSNISNSQVTNAKLDNMSGFTIKGKATTGSGAPTDISLATNTILGRGAGNISALSLGTNLSITGTTLNAAAPAPQNIQQTLDVGGTAVTSNAITLNSSSGVSLITGGNIDLGGGTDAILSANAVKITGTGAESELSLNADYLTLNDNIFPTTLGTVGQVLTTNGAGQLTWTVPTAANAVLLTGNQSVDDIKTFTSIPVLPATNPTTNNQATRKGYVDELFNQSTNIQTTQVFNVSSDLSITNFNTNFAYISQSDAGVTTLNIPNPEENTGKQVQVYSISMLTVGVSGGGSGFFLDVDFSVVNTITIPKVEVVKFVSDGLRWHYLPN